MQGQLWRLFEEVAKHSFTISHLKSQDNVLADMGSRRTNLIDLTDEEKELFGDVIEERVKVRVGWVLVVLVLRQKSGRKASQDRGRP